MADIELLIKVPEEIYKMSQIIDVVYEDVIQIPLEVIANATPRETVTEFADRCRECGREKVLDKIRAELIQSIQNGTLKIENGNEELFRIIDKYKAKSGVQE
jgi:hypothetical protein